MINKAIIEIPLRFSGRPPIGPLGAPASRRPTDDWSSATGLTEEMHRHGYWMREEAEKHIRYSYPKMKITGAMIEGRGGGSRLPARRRRSPGLISSF